MLSLIIVLSEIALVSLLAGLLIGGYFHLDRVGTEVDRCLIAVWSGIGILPSILLAIGLLCPLSPLVGQLVMLSISIVALAQSGVRHQLHSLLLAIRQTTITPALLTVSIVAVQLVRPIVHYDTGLYHYGTINWLSKHGVVSGMALVHFRAAFSPAWFALTAVFNHGIFEGRLLTVANGALYLLAILHFSICASRWIGGSGTIADRFITIAFGVALLIATHFDRLQLSSSPNLPVVFLTIVVWWMTIMMIGQWHPVSAKDDIVVGVELLPVLIAACLTSIKLNGGAVLTATLLSYIISGRNKIWMRRAIVGGGLSLLILTPFLLYEVITSGYLAYPIPLTNLKLPWSIDPETVRLHAMAVRDWSRWNGATPPEAAGWNWIPQWFDHGAAFKNVVLFNAGAILLALGTIWSGRWRQLLRSVLGRAILYLPALIALGFWMRGRVALKEILISIGIALASITIIWLCRRIVRISSPSGFMTGFQGITRLFLAIPIDGWMILAGGSIAGYMLLTRAPSVLIVLSVNGLIVELLLDLISDRRDPFPGKVRIALGTLGGLGLVLYAAPALEYGLGYVASAIGLLVVSNYDRIRRLAGGLEVTLHPRLVTAIVLLLVASPVVVRNSNLSRSLIIPPLLRDTECRTIRVNNVDLNVPVRGDQCWRCSLPCGPSIEHHGLTLQDRSQGISGGFMLQ